ncbi:MAG TPA: PH domain-containing protein [Bacillales bacterium]|nr:PH domain-containing protein [Bacillales bacterium]
MGWLSGWTGNAGEADIPAVECELEPVLMENERVEQAYQLVRDLIVFTRRRMILVDKQGMTGKKTDYHSIPYRSISHFSIETAGRFDFDAELKIWLSHAHEPIIKQFKKDKNVYEIQKTLAEYTT